MIPVEALLQALVMMAMTVVGFELTFADLQRVLHYPAHVLVSVVGQVVVLPALAVALIALLEPGPLVAGGLVLVSVAPQATAANLACLLGRTDVALSVTVTAVSSLAALVTTPFAGRLVFDVLLKDPIGFDLPPSPVMRQIFLGMLLPIALGMAARPFLLRFVEGRRGLLQAVTLAVLILMLALMVFDQGAAMAREIRDIALAAAAFTAGAAATGLVISRALRWPRNEVVSTALGFSLRSLSVATLIAIDVLGSTGFLAFAAPFFIVQALMMVPAIFVARRLSDRG